MLQYLVNMFETEDRRKVGKRPPVFHLLFWCGLFCAMGGHVRLDAESLATFVPSARRKYQGKAAIKLV